MILYKHTARSVLSHVSNNVKVPFEIFVDHRGYDACEVAILYIPAPNAALPDDAQRSVTRVKLGPNWLTFSTSILASINDNYILAYLSHGLLQLLEPRSGDVQPVHRRWIEMALK